MCMKVNVQVTANDIKYGVREDGESCAIARSLKRDGFKEVSVGDHIEVRKMGVLWRYDGKAHQSFISKFDDNKKSVKPRKFMFDFKPINVVKEETTEQNNNNF